MTEFLCGVFIGGWLVWLIHREDRRNHRERVASLERRLSGERAENERTIREAGEFYRATRDIFQNRGRVQRHQ